MLLRRRLVPAVLPMVCRNAVALRSSAIASDKSGGLAEANILASSPLARSTTACFY